MTHPQRESSSLAAAPDAGSGLTPAQCRAVAVALRERGRIDVGREPADDRGWTADRVAEAG